jgi:hypothetical protein
MVSFQPGSHLTPRGGRLPALPTYLTQQADPEGPSHTALISLMDVSIVNVLASGAGLWFAYNVLRYAVRRRATVLKGPPSKSFLFGLSEYLLTVPDPSVVYDEWSHIYGAVFQIPTEFGGTRVIVCDPKAIAHVLGHETSTYVKPPLWRAFMKILFGVGLVTAEGESHKRSKYIHLFCRRVVC